MASDGLNTSRWSERRDHDVTDRLGCDADFSTSPADLMERARSILSAPLPACLQLDGTTIAPPPLPAASASYLRRLLQLSANPHPAHRPAQDGFGAGGKPIHEVLLEKGRLSQEHKEKLAQDYIAKEVSELRPAPGLTQTRRLPPPGERIEDKLLRRGKEREAQRQQVAEQHAAREAETLAKVAPFRPTISDRARRTQTRYTEPKVSPRLAEARAKRQEQREQERLAAEAADLAEVKEVPTINERSRKLAARKDAKDGLAGLDPVEALLARDHLAKLKRWEQSHADLNKSATSSSGTAVPRITSYAASLDRPGDVGTRLYATHQDTLTRQQVRWMEEQALAAPFVPQITAKATLTAPRYHRSVRQSTSVVSETDSAEDEPAWSARQVERQLRSSLTRRSAEVEEAAAAHQPVIDPVSAAIASQLPETSRERLYRGVTHRQVPRHADASSDIVAFEGSRRGGSSDAGLPPSFLDALAAYEARRQARLEALIEEEERRREAEHTFAPRINRAPFFPLMDEGSGGSGHNDDEDASWYEEEGGPAAVAARSQRWLRRKEARLAQRRHQLEREREEAAEAEMRAAATTLRSRSAPRGGAHAAPGGCDEAAGRGDRRADGDSLLASAAAFPPPPPPGVQAYLQRQARAQRERAEREALLQSTALGQRPARAAPTVPRSPTLGGRPHCSIRSLRRPVDPLRQRREERSGSRSPTPPDAVERSVSSALSSLPTFERIYRSVYRGESGFH